jgi:hypothetical protein
VLEFGSDCHAQPSIEKANFVLQERAKLIQRNVVWLERDRRARSVGVLNRSIAQAPNQLLGFAQVNVMLKIDVVHGLVIREKRIVNDVGLVKVDLQGGGGAGKIVIPTS